MKAKILLLTGLVCLLAVSCSLFKPAAATPEPTTTPEIFQPLPADQRAFEAVRALLARQLGVDPLTISLVDVQPVDWPDSCLDLPGPSEACSQVVTSGFLLHVKAGTTVYEFHTDETAASIRQVK